MSRCESGRGPEAVRARRSGWIGPLALCAALIPLSACKRHHRGAVAGAHYAGPSLGNASALLRATRVINPQRVLTTAPFDTVIALPSATLGIAGGRLYRLAATQTLGGLPLDPFEGRTVRALAGAGGDVVYALVNSDRPFIARSTDAGATWVGGASVSEGSVPSISIDPRLANPESTPGLAASGQTVVFWLGEACVISRDGGSTVAPLGLQAIVRSLAVSDAGTVVALARNPEAGDGPGFLIARADVTNSVTRTVLPSTDPCTASKVHRLNTGALLLGDSTHLLGVCARMSANDGRTFTDHVRPGTDPVATTQLLATASGVLLNSSLISGRRALSFSQDNGTTLVALQSALAGMPFDIATDNTIAVGLSDAMLRLPGTHDDAAAVQFRALLGSDSRFRLGFAAARDAIATLDPRGSIAVVTPGAQGPQLRRFGSPCRFPGERTSGRDLSVLALDGRGHVCCTSSSGGFDTDPGSAACADIDGGDPRVWRPIAGGVQGLASGDGAIGVIGVIGTEPRCILDGQPAAAQPVALLGLAAETAVRDVSCSRNGAAAAFVHPGTFTIFTPFQLRAANALGRRAELEPAVGPSSHVLARADGTVAAAFESTAGPTIRRWRADNARPLRSWQPDATMMAPSILAAWDDHVSILSMRNALVVLGPAGVSHRAFAESERYEAVARVGSALVGVTGDGRFAVLEAR